MEVPKGTTRFALLGLLSFGPSSGYGLKKLVEESISHFWSESYGQIYPTLRRLEAERRVTRRKDTGRGRPERHLYTITTAGRQELERWLALPARFEPPRSELLLRLFFGGRTSLPVSRRQVEGCRALHRSLLERYDQVEGSLRANYGRHPDLRWWLLTLNFGRHRSRAFVEWSEQTLAAISRWERASPGRTRRKRIGSKNKSARRGGRP